jgi:hypothetical protein
MVSPLEMPASTLAAVVPVKVQLITVPAIPVAGGSFNEVHKGFHDWFSFSAHCFLAAALPASYNAFIVTIYRELRPARVIIQSNMIGFHFRGVLDLYTYYTRYVRESQGV